MNAFNNTKDRYDQFASNISWYGVFFMRNTTSEERIFDSKSARVLASYHKAITTTTPSDMDEFNSACASWRGEYESAGQSAS
jgi:hypothetical protein